MNASRSRRVRRVQRHVGAARPSARPAAPPPAPASAPGRAPPARRAPRPGRAARAPGRWRARSAPVGQRARRRTPPPPRPASAPPAPRTARAAASRAGSRARVAFHALRAAAAPRRSSSGSSDSRASGIAPRSPRAASAQAPTSRSTVPASNRSVLYSKVAAQPARRLAQVQRQVELRRCARQRLERQRQARQRQPPGAARSAARTSPGTAGVRLRSRSGLQLRHQPLERHVLVRVGAQRRPRAPAPAARGSSGRPTGRARSTSVLTKKPISPSSSRRVAARDRRADRDVLLRRCSRDSSAWNAASSVMNSVAPSRRLSALQRAPLSARGSTRAALRPAEASAPPGAAGRSAAPAAGSAGELPRPVGELRLQHAALPASRAARPRSRRTGSAAPASGDGRPAQNARVERRQLAEQDAERPAVGDDVVQRQQQHVLLARPAAAGGSANERPRRQVEGAPRPPRSSSRRAPPRARRCRERREVQQREPIADRRGAITCTGSPSTAAKRGAQHLVAAHDLRRGAAPAPRRPARPVSRQRRRDRCAPVLPGSSWSRNQSRCCANESGSEPVARHRHGAARRRQPRDAARSVHRARPARPRVGASNSAAQRQLHAERAPRSRETTCVASSECAAQLEEVVVHADALHAQHLRPDPRERLARSALRGAT